MFKIQMPKNPNIIMGCGGKCLQHQYLCIRYCTLRLLGYEYHVLFLYDQLVTLYTSQDN